MLSFLAVFSNHKVTQRRLSRTSKTHWETQKCNWLFSRSPIFLRVPRRVCDSYIRNCFFCIGTSYILAFESRACLVCKMTHGLSILRLNLYCEWAGSILELAGKSLGRAEVSKGIGSRSSEWEEVCIPAIGSPQGLGLFILHCAPRW